MRIIWNELKKIITLKIMLVLLLVSVVFYQLFIMFDFNFFAKGRPTKDELLVTQEMIKKYGKIMDGSELKDLKNTYNEKVAEATKYLQSTPDMKEAGLDTYQKFRSADRNNKQQDRLISKVMFEDEVDLFWELQARRYIIDRFEQREQFGYGYKVAPLTKQEAARVKELLDSTQANAIFPWFVYDNYNRLAESIGILIMLSVMIVISPLYLTDRRNNVQLMQYSSKTGRSLLQKKFVAALIAVFAVIVVQLACFFYLYRGNGTSLFFPIKISSLYSGFISWYNLSFLQYIILTVISMVVLGISVLCLVAFISSVAPNYMTIIGLQVPLAGFLFWLGIRYCVYNVTDLFLPKYFLASALIIVLGISLMVIVFRMRREMVIDIH